MKSSALLIGISALISISSLSSCKDDEEFKGDPYFSVEGLTDYLAPSAGISKEAWGNGVKFTVRAIGDWRFEDVDEEANEWARVFPMEGADDGYIRFYADENLIASKRVAQYRVFLNGVEQPQLLEISQESCEGFLNISTSQLTFAKEGGELSVTVSANLPWECHIDGDSDGHFSCEAVDGTMAVVRTTGANSTGSEINARLVIAGTGENADLFRQEIALTQLDAVFFDNFSWLESKAGIFGWKADDGYSEIRIDNWTAAEKQHGWSSLSTWVYARTGFLKFGKAGYGGDLASPAIPELGTSSNVNVGWKALGYATAKNVKDTYTTYYVAVLGEGQITSCSSQGTLGHKVAYRDAAGNDVTLDAVQFSFSNNAWMMQSLDPTATVIWQEPDAQFSMKVSGMNADSKIIFISGDGNPDGKFINSSTSTNSRFFLDDFKVSIQ